jgi:RNA polymerase subunit RPABC4/transcription elongation factor Spt4
MILLDYSDLLPKRTASTVYVNEIQTDWYSTGFFTALKDDRIEINVDVAGGQFAKLRVDKQEGGYILPEVSGTLLRYSVLVPSDSAYGVFIWTRQEPFTSTYVNLTGTIELKRTYEEIPWIGYSAITVGSLIALASASVYFHEIYKQRQIRRMRICPYCAQRVEIEKLICPYCGFDITRSIRCKYCNAYYDRSLEKCPSCGAKQS